MSDRQSEVSGSIRRRPRKKTGAAARKKATKEIMLLLRSKPRLSGKTWDDDFPEFLERLKALMKRFKITVKTIRKG